MISHNIRLISSILLSIFIIVSCCTFLLYTHGNLLELQSLFWPTYSNSSLGISFKYPNLPDGEKIVFIQTGNILFVTNASSSLYTHQSELIGKNDSEILKKAEEINGNLVSWAIWVRDASNDQQLSDLIEDRYGNLFPGGCKLGKKTSSNQKNISDVAIDAVQGDSGYADSSCINWIASFKFSSEFSRAALWDIGQEGKFFVDNSDAQWCKDYRCQADYLMAKSFKFISKANSK